MLSTALLWHSRGVMPLPLAWGTKRAAVAWRQYQAVGPTGKTVAKWFSGQRRNLGLLCGPVSSNLVVLDFDRLRQYYLWCLHHPDLASSYTVTTPRPGRHVYLFLDDLPDKTLNLPGLDVKVSGYVLAPPSQVGKVRYQASNHTPIVHASCLENVLDIPSRKRDKPSMRGSQRLPQGDIAHRSTGSIIADIKANLSVTDLLSEYTALQPSEPTGRYWVMRCPMPWHEDKSPSFWADAATGRCSCFASWCRVKFGGRPLDVIGLTRYLEGMTLAQAIASLAQRLEL